MEGDFTKNEVVPSFFVETARKTRVMTGKISRVPKWIVWLSPLVILVVAAKFLNQNPPVSAAQTSFESEEVALKTRFYDAPWRDVVDATQSVLAAQKTYWRAWKTGSSSIGGAAPGAKLHETLRAQVPVILFTDDLEVTLSETDGGQIQVDCASKSRIGRGDFGENRRHIIQFLGALDEKLAR